MTRYPAAADLAAWTPAVSVLRVGTEALQHPLKTTPARRVPPPGWDTQRVRLCVSQPRQAADFKEPVKLMQDCISFHDTHLLQTRDLPSVDPFSLHIQLFLSD
ncbi:hypothetical protein AV530_009793 [Patagioenas fasciata monilis]|uniref:Uncharacterized protein n=1 Tax=Patagioenas fasciata monilis TaxID=372326 RepID=A0A1V4KAD9_PATFA|nr:hypothetical protein AV530_009793 [Patagioenas fasciata monilis]